MEELKKCPFCGGEARLVNEDAIWVECSACLCGTPFLRGVSTEEEKIKIAISDWNKRVE